MKVIVVAWLLIGGIWYPGELFDGWGPHETDRTFEECQRDIEKINEELVDVQLECILVDGG